MEKFKALPHTERMHSSRFAFPKCGKYPEEEEVFTTESVDINGVITQRQCIKKVSLKDKFTGLKCSDFALENIVAAGAINTLKPVSIGAGSSVESVENTIANVESFLASAENIQTESKSE